MLYFQLCSTPSIRSRTEKADALTFVSQLDQQTSTRFDHSAEDSSRTVADLAYSVASGRSSSSLQLHVQSSPLNEFNNVELHRPTVRGPVQTNFFNTRPKHSACFHIQSTMSNSIDQLYVKSSLVELYQHPSKMACPSTMSNSIGDRDPVNNVELHRLSKLTRPVFSLEIAVELSDTAN